MEYIRINTHLNGRLICDHAYAGNNTKQAIERFYAEYPEQEKCNIKTQIIDSEDEAWTEWFKSALQCGCLH